MLTVGSARSGLRDGLEPLRVERTIRRLRGGANAHLMLAADGHYYAVKFRNNPQHSRILVNELVCYTLLEHLDLPTPGWAIVEVTRDLVNRTPQLIMEFGRECVTCEPGLHFGSQYPVDPTRVAVYDYVPIRLLKQVVNLECFVGMAVFDKWVSNADGRQAIFHRDLAEQWIGMEKGIAIEGRRIGPRSLVYVARMIDHGFAFNAQNWEFTCTAEQGFYSRPEVYEHVRGLKSFEPWLARVQEMPSGVLDVAYNLTPPEWYEQESDRFEALLEGLYARRKDVADLLAVGKTSSRNPFPNWD